MTLRCGQVSLWWRLRTRTALCAQQVSKTQRECQPQSGSRCCFSEFVVSLASRIDSRTTLVLDHDTNTLSWHCGGFWSRTRFRSVSLNATGTGQWQPAQLNINCRWDENCMGWAVWWINSVSLSQDWSLVRRNELPWMMLNGDISIESLERCWTMASTETPSFS